MNRTTRPPIITTRLALLAAALAGCSEGSEHPNRDDGAGTSPAVMVSLLVPGPDASNFYVGVYPSLPRELDLSAMLEIRSGYDARAFNGFVYVWEGESGTYTRYGVDERLRISEGPALSFRDFGGTGTVMTSFVSPHLAYSLTRDELAIVAWDPTEMAVLGSISGDALIDPEYPELDYGEPVVFGDYVAWPIQWTDYDNNRFSREVGVVLASTSSLEPATVLRDGRCGGGWSLFVDDRGDLYVTGNANFGYAHFFASDAETTPNDCVVRIKAGTLEFDPEYVRDLNAATGSPAVYHPWHQQGRALVAAVWDPAADPVAIGPDDYWTTPLLRKLVRIDDTSSQVIEGVSKSAVWSTLSHRLDDELYLLSTDGTPFGGDGAGGRSSLYRVTEDGAELALSSSGFLWSIGRVR
jgi:hypothetical protein